MPRAGGRGTKLKGWAKMRALGPAKSLGDPGVLQGKTPRPTMEALGPKRPLRKPQGLLAYHTLMVPLAHTGVSHAKIILGPVIWLRGQRCLLPNLMTRG